ncbi:MAG: polysaccharide deacetylase family protein [Ignavibacteriales bacterium]|nr:polysaccharide deacetylase family protein [Ignavibacteriales bacterium]
MKQNRFLLILIILINSYVVAQNKIAVTIDDLPLQRIGSYSKEQYESLTKKLLANLSSQMVPIIGFVNEGKLFTNNKLDENKVALLKQWLDAGFELGNHSFSHKSANQISAEKFNDDILKGEQVIRKLVESYGKRLEYFRHPFLHTGLSLAKRDSINDFLSNHNYKIAPITFDNSEWIYAAAYDKAIKEKNEQMMNKIGEDYLSYMELKLEYWESQSITLFGRNISQTLLIHANAVNAEYFDELCEIIGEKNYAFVTLDEALKDEAYESPDTFIKNNGISWIHRWAITQGKKKDFFGNEPEASKWVADYAGIDYE